MNRIAFRNGILTFLIVNIVMLTDFMTSCSGDEAVEEDDTASLSGEIIGGGEKADIDRLYEELVGEYERIRAIIKYADGGETLEFKPPEATRVMTITLTTNQAGG